MQILSKPEIKKISSLKISKYRYKNKQFVVEGEKIVLEAIESSYELLYLIATEDWYRQHQLPNDLPESKKYVTTAENIKRMSSLVTPQNVMAVMQMPQLRFDIHSLQEKFSIVLENIQDPGNLGTIIRTADWFGIENIICSEDSVDCYNPKVVQASMGAIFRVKIFYTRLNTLIDEAKKIGIEIIGSYLNGKNVYHFQFPNSFFLIMGNESKGISPILSSKIKNRITIPSNYAHKKGAESLSVAIATSIICAEWQRKLYYNSFFNT